MNVLTKRLKILIVIIVSVYGVIIFDSLFSFDRELFSELIFISI